MRKKLMIAIMAVLILVFGFSAYNVGKILWDNYQVKKTYESLQTQYVTILPTQAPSKGENPSAPVTPEVQPPKMAVDFEALRQVNKEVVGWLYCEDTYIHYPVVQGRDNVKYVRTGFNGSWLISGTLFVDFRNGKLGQDKNYIIYGHNMKTDRMFGSLLKYKEQDYYEKHKTLLYLTPEGDYLLEAVAGRIVYEEESLYTPNPDPVAYEAFLESMLRNSTFDSGISITEEDKFIVLSTCSQEKETTRYVLLCKYTLIED